MGVDAGDEPSVVIRPRLPEVRKSASGPEPPNPLVPFCAGSDFRILGEPLQDRQVDRFRRRSEARPIRSPLEVADQPVEAREVGITLAPV